MKTDIHNLNGELSYYGLSCGYVERVENDENEQITELYFDGVYHVRLIDKRAPNFGSNDFNKGLDCGRFWLSFESLTLARRIYNKLKTRVILNWDYLDILTFDNGEI